MKRFLLSVALLLACSGVALAQESEFSGGGGGGITAAPGSGTVNVLPRFASATSVVDSPFVVGGTAAAPVLHFSLSGVVGITSPAIYATTSNIAFRNGTDAAYVAVTGGDITSTYSAAGSGIGGGWADAGFTTFRAVANKGDVGTFQIGSAGAYNFGSTTGNQRTEVPDTGIARSAAGILAITDGSTGYGMLRASRLGVGTAPVTADGLNITATTGMTSNLRLVGTSGIINPIITFVDVGPTTGSITWQSPAMELRGGSGHYMSLNLSSTPAILFGDNANDAGIEWVEGSTLKITDASTGSGGIGIADSATNTVTDALILRHATTDAGFGQDGFGTGLLFQGEDDAGNMNSMAQIQAVYTDSANGSEDAEFRLYGMVGGTLTRGLSFTSQMRGSGPPGIASTSGISIEADGPLILTTNNSATSIVFGNYQVAYFWKINSADGHFQPYTTNTYDIGTSSAFVRNNYVSTSIQGTRDEVIPTDNVAENFVQISSATENAVTAGYIEYTVTAVDTTNEIIQTETGVVPFVAVNENTTVTSTLGTPYGVHQDNAGGAALAVSFAAVVTGTNVMMTVTSNYDQATLTGTVVNTLRYRVVLTSGTATVTPQT